jgi:hypothetical protein
MGGCIVLSWVVIIFNSTSLQPLCRKTLVTVPAVPIASKISSRSKQPALDALEVDVVVLLPRNTPPKTLLQNRLVLLDVQVVPVAAAQPASKQVTHTVKNPKVTRHQAPGVMA